MRQQSRSGPPQIHGHPPLTAMFTIDAMPGLQAPFRSLYDRSLDAAHAARPLAELLHDNFIPASLRDTPKAVLPYLIARDTFVSGSTPSTPDTGKRTARAWRTSRAPNGRSRWTSSVAIAKTRSGEPPIGWSSAVMPRSRSASPSSASLVTPTVSRFCAAARALTTLSQINSQMNPFRFIVYSEWSGKALAPVSPQ